MTKQKLQISNRIYYEIISSCNLKCIHCSDLLQETSSKLLAKDIIRFHKEMIKYNITNCVVTGGEPGLHKEFELIVNELASISNVSITTNGTILDVDLICRILKDNPNVILQISMDGYTKETFETIRGKNTYDKIMNLINKIDNNNLCKQVGLSMTIMKQNYSEIKNLIDFARKHQFAFIHFPALLPVGLAREKWDEIAPDVNQQIHIEEMILNEMLNEDFETVISSNRVEQIITHTVTKGNIDCLNNFTIKVAPNGEILPCPAAPSNKNLAIGNIKEPDISNTLIERMHKRSQEFYDIACNESNSCTDCNVNAYCRGRFCANCGILSVCSKKYTDYGCKIMQHHLYNALKEMNENE